MQVLVGVDGVRGQRQQRRRSSLGRLLGRLGFFDRGGRQARLDCRRARLAQLLVNALQRQGTLVYVVRTAEMGARLTSV